MYLAGGAPSGNVYIWEVSNQILYFLRFKHHLRLQWLIYIHVFSAKQLELSSDRHDDLNMIQTIVSNEIEMTCRLLMEDYSKHGGHIISL